jgi:divalent metal cation (Fe/Co/Zn/Cd) transporter
MPSHVVQSAGRECEIRKGRRLEYFTLGWNLTEAVVGVGAGVGMCLSAISIVVMPLLARAKRHVAARLNSRALVADSRQTDLCAYLSGILFVGLVLNALFGWWWADSLAAILMVPIIAREGVEAFKGHSL